MKLFLDTAELDEIEVAARWGVLDGVTTNPSLFARVGGNYDDVLRKICRIASGPVSAEVVAESVDGMLAEGRHFAGLAPNIVVKVAMSEEGLEVIARLKAEGIRTNCTLIFSANQGLLAAKAGASLLSPFVGRLDDISARGMNVVRELVRVVRIHDLASEVLDKVGRRQACQHEPERRADEDEDQPRLWFHERHRCTMPKHARTRKPLAENPSAFARSQIGRAFRPRRCVEFRWWRLPRCGHELT